MIWILLRKIYVTNDKKAVKNLEITALADFFYRYQKRNSVFFLFENNLQV